MSLGAVIMMIVAIGVLWGGLTLAVLSLIRYQGAEPTEVHRDL